MTWAGLVCVIALELGTAAPAQEALWQTMTGAQISASSTGRTLEYGTPLQDFRASSRTLYFSGREAWGHWAVREDHCCSMWPPSDFWACYGMQTDGHKLRFVGEHGAFTERIYNDWRCARD